MPRRRTWRLRTPTSFLPLNRRSWTFPPPRRRRRPPSPSNLSTRPNAHRPRWRRSTIFWAAWTRRRRAWWWSYQRRPWRRRRRLIPVWVKKKWSSGCSPFSTSQHRQQCKVDSRVLGAAATRPKIRLVSLTPGCAFYTNKISFWLSYRLTEFYFLRFFVDKNICEQKNLLYCGN